MTVVFALITLLQASTASTPLPEHMTRDMKSRAEQKMLETPIQTGSAERPLAWTFPSSAKVLRNVREMHETSVASGWQTIVPPLAASPIAGCRKFTDSPRGFPLVGSTVLNGRTTAFDCGNFVAEVVDEDLTKPIGALVTYGYPAANIDTIINRGTLLRRFHRDAQGGREILLQWLRADRAVSVTITSEQLGYDAMIRSGDLLLNALTRG